MPRNFPFFGHELRQLEFRRGQVLHPVCKRARAEAIKSFEEIYPSTEAGVYLTREAEA